MLKIAELDGAFLIGEQGKLVAFGARIKKSQALPGYGTKHAAAVGITFDLAAWLTSWLPAFTACTAFNPILIAP